MRRPSDGGVEGRGPAGLVLADGPSGLEVVARAARGGAVAPGPGGVRGRLRAQLIGGTFIIAAVALLCVAVFALIGWNILLARDAAERAATRTVENLASLASHDSEAHIASADAFLRGVLAVLPLDGPPRLTAAHYAVLSALAREDGGLGAVVILDGGGRPLHLVGAHGETVVQPAVDFATSVWFLDAVREPGRLVVGPPGIGLFSNRQVLPVARAVADRDGVRSVVMAEILVESFEQSLADLDLGSDGVVWLLWGGETVVFRLPSIDGNGNTGRTTRGSPDALPYLGAPRAPYQGAIAIDGVTRLYAFRSLPDVPMILAVGVGHGYGVLGFGWRRQAVVSLAITAVVCSVMFGIALLLRREIARRNATEQNLWLLSETDPLTNLANRRRFERVIITEMRRASRNRRPVSVLVVDIDRFKTVNDRHGHAYGDMVLQVVAKRLLAAARRPGDLVARVGGDEFALLLPETDAKGARAVAEAARTDVEATVFPELGGTTITVGIATFDCLGSISPSDLIAAADRALYAAKEAGRNRTIHWTDLVEGSI